MSFKCPNCGGNTKFDIATRSLHCESCDSFFEIDEKGPEDERESVEKYYENNLFQCKSCGAQLMTTNDEATVYCPYCGSQAYIKGKIKENIPKKIIPFTKTEEYIENQYDEALKKQWFVPKDLKQKNRTCKFNGIYMPYWTTIYEMDGLRRKVNGSKHYISGNYEYFENYVLDFALDGEINDITFDASYNFDDTIASAIAPYDVRVLKDFQEEYVAGFYADRPTVNPDNYQTYGDKEVANKIDKELQHSAGNIQFDSTDRESLYNPKKKESVLYMLPVWFMTYKTKDRVAYAVANGSTGKLTTDIPVDKKAFFVAVFATTIVIFAILSLISVAIEVVAVDVNSFINPYKTLLLSSIISIITSFILYFVTEKVTVIDSELYNIGKLKTKEDIETVSKYTKRKKHKIKSPRLIIVLLIAMIGLPALSVMLSSQVPTTIIFLMSITQIILMIATLKSAALFDDKKYLPATIASLISMIFALGVCVLNPVNDIWPLLASIILVSSGIYNGITCINYFNYLTTRPVPNFFERGDENE